MRFMVMVRATAESETGKLPETEMLEAMGRFNEELAAAGVMQAGEGLHPSSAGARVRFDGTDRTVTNGPFPDNELVAGYWIWELPSLEEAIEWVKRCPNPMDGPSDIEIRQIYESDDFGDNMTDELRDREERLRKQIAGG